VLLGTLIRFRARSTVTKLFGIIAYLFPRYAEFLSYLSIGKAALKQRINCLKPLLTTKCSLSSYNCDWGVEFSLAAPAAKLYFPSSKLRARPFKLLSAEVTLDKKSRWFVRLSYYPFQDYSYPLSG
jgi:hypothetical protein